MPIKLWNKFPEYNDVCTVSYTSVYNRKMNNLLVLHVYVMKYNKMGLDYVEAKPLYDF